MLLPDIQTGDIYLGTDEVEKMYIGDVEVWPCPGGCDPYAFCGCIQGSTAENNLFIELPFKTGGTLKWRLLGKIQKTSGGNIIGGNYTVDSNDYRLFFTSQQFYLDMGAYRLHALSSQYFDTDIDITVGNFYLYDNLGSKYILNGSSVGNVPSENTLKLNIPCLTIYDFYAWETSGGTDELIFHGEPRIRIEDNKPGLYDTVTDTFYTNEEATIYACITP